MKSWKSYETIYPKGVQHMIFLNIPFMGTYSLLLQDEFKLFDRIHHFMFLYFKIVLYPLKI